jgi:uncharacterized protein YbbC (DUF1343 family)
MLTRRQLLKRGGAGVAGAALLNGLTRTAAASGTAGARGSRVRTGVEVLIEQRGDLVSGKKLGIVTNPG